MIVLVLAVDTSTPRLTVGVVDVLEPHEVIAAMQAAGAAPGSPPEPDALVAERVVTDGFGHAEKLMPLVDEEVTSAGCRLADLRAVVVGVGPGPFTGLRIGMVTAAALGDALDIPVHGVPSHDAVAAAVAADTAPGAVALTPAAEGLVVVTDARRKEVYVSAYGAGGTRTFGPEVLSPADVAQALRAADLRPTAVTGAGADLVSAVVDLPTVEVGSLARGLVRCAHRALVTGVVPGPLVPLYLRRPDATEPHAPKPVLTAEAPR